MKEQYSIDTIEIKNYRSNLLNLITESEDYQAHYNEVSFIPGNDLKNEVLVFNNRNNKTFKNVIIKINGC